MYGTQRLISARLVDEMHQAHTVIRTTSAARASNPDTHLQAYGSAGSCRNYRGKVLVHHGGNVDGFTALVAMMPEERFGVVLLTNMNGTGLPNALMLKLFDLQLKAPAKDWSGEGLQAVGAGAGAGAGAGGAGPRRGARGQHHAHACRWRRTRGRTPTRSTATW
jgi:hypothetical protein